MKYRKIQLAVFLLSFIWIFAAIAAAEPAAVEEAVVYETEEAVFHMPDFEVRVTGTEGAINFRSGPSMDDDVLTEIYNGEHLQITDLSFNRNDILLWGYTSYRGKEGWVSIRQTTIRREEGYSLPDYYAVVSAGEEGMAALRYGASLDSQLLAGIPEGQQLHITDLEYNADDGYYWGKTSYLGQEGWISLAMLETDHSGEIQVGWKLAYKTYVADQEYISHSSAEKFFYPDAEIFLADLNGDNTPELFVYCGDGTQQGDCWDIYTFLSWKVQRIGPVSGIPYGSDPEKVYMGVFFSEGTDDDGVDKYVSLIDFNLSESVVTKRYYNEERKARAEDVVAEDTSLNSALERAKNTMNATYYSRDAIQEMGWDAFLENFGY